MARVTQQFEALALANQRRAEQVALRRRINKQPHHRGRAMVVAILRSPTPEQGRVKVAYLLGSIASFGPSRREKLFRKTGLAPGRFERRIADLSERELHLIADHLEDPALPAHTANFTGEELALIDAVCTRLSRKVNGECGELLRSITLKIQDLAHWVDEQGQQADGQGVPVPLPDRDLGNGPKSRHRRPPSSPAPVADLEGVV